MIRTFIDSNVLIAAARERAPEREKALKLLSDPARQFASSVFVQLETLPRAHFLGRSVEFNFYEGFFAAVRHWAKDLDAITKLAFTEGLELGLSAMDALHLAAAVSIRCDQLVTLEAPDQPIHRTNLVKVAWLRRP